MSNSIYISTSNSAKPVIMSVDAVGRNKMIVTPPVPPQYGPVITDWADRVVANGGDAPSAGTKAALNTFYNSLVSAGIDSKMLSVNCIVPDNLTASMTPLIATKGYSIWTNGGYISSDLSVNGILDPDNTAYLDTGFTSTTDYADSNNAGFTVCGKSTNAGTRTGAMMLSYGVGYRSAGVYVSSAINIYGCFYSHAGNTNIAIPGAINHFDWISVSRYDALLCGVFHGSDDLGFTNLGTVNSATNTRSSRPIYLNGRSGTALKPNAANYYSFAAIHFALDATESQNFYNACRALRVSLGGGYA